MNKNSKRLSLYPLRFQEVIADVLKVKPEPKKQKPKVKHAKRKERHESPMR